MQLGLLPNFGINTVNSSAKNRQAGFHDVSATAVALHWLSGRGGGCGFIFVL
ncbi:MAG: hypothetical protein ACJASI_001619 [Glaciecola sp.]|jgi:hypothetical protein